MIDPFKTFSDKIINKPNEHNKFLRDRYRKLYLTDIVKEQYYFDIDKVIVGDVLLLDNKDKNLCNGILGEFRCIVTDVNIDENSISVVYVKEGCDFEGKNYIEFTIDVSYISGKDTYDEHIKLMDTVPSDYLCKKNCFDKEKLKVGDYIPLFLNGEFLEYNNTDIIFVDAFVSNIFQDILSIIFVYSVEGECPRLSSLDISVQDFKENKVRIVDNV